MKKQPTQKLIAIKNGKGEIKGYITVFWSKSLNKFVTIPE